MRKNYYSVLLLLSSLLITAQDNKIVTSFEYQETLNKEYSERDKSPLKEEDFKNFKGLDFYPIDSKYKVTARFKRTKGEKVFEMKTTGTKVTKHKKYGELEFEIDGQVFKLNLYQNIILSKNKEYKDYLFLPFTDYTSGVETYGGGRYLDFKIPKSKLVELDFNKAYNPYCAYNNKYSCPLVPEENNLNIEIKAGVKKFKKDGIASLVE